MAVFLEFILLDSKKLDFQMLTLNKTWTSNSSVDPYSRKTLSCLLLNYESTIK